VALQAKATKDTPPITPVEDLPAPVAAPEEPASETPAGDKAEEHMQSTEQVPALEQEVNENGAAVADENAADEDQQDIPQQSIEVR
jgi:hypothetical protein